MFRDSITLLPHASLLAGAAICFAGGRIFKSARMGGAICLLTFLLAAAGLVEASQAGFTAATDAIVLQSRLGLLLQSAGLGLGLLYALCAIGSSKSHPIPPETFSLLLLSVCGLMLVAVANDLWLMYVAAELSSIPFCVMLFASRQEDFARRSATKHLTMILLSSAVLLYGLSLVYGAAGATNLAALREALTATAAISEQSGAPQTPLGDAGLVLILAALGYRIAAAPFHLGMADVFEGATPWSAGAMISVSQATALIVVIRCLIPNLVGFEATGQLVCLVLSATSMTVGSALALAQTNIRRILAYLTVAQVGVILAGLAVGFWDASAPERSFERWNALPGGVVSCLFYLGSSLLATGGMVAILVYLARGKQQIEHVEDLAGLISREPLAAVCATTCLLSLAGVPPLPGFWGRLFVLASALSVHQPPERQHLPQPNSAFILVAILSIACFVMIAAACLRIVVVMIFEGQVARPEPSGGKPALAAAFLAGMITVSAGLLPGPIVGCLHRAVAQTAALQLNRREADTVPVVESETDIPAPRAPRRDLRR